MMRKKTKGWLIAATVLVVLGLALFAAAMAASNWNFTGLNTAKYETSTHEISDSFDSISLYTDTADIIFVPSNDGTCSVTCYEPEYEKHTVSVQNGILTIREVDTGKWYNNINIASETPRIALYLPDAEYHGLFISESTGDIEIPKEFRFEGMDISVSTGDIRVESVSAASLDLSVSTGHVTVSGTDCRDDVSIHVSTGKASLTDVTCTNLFSDGGTGDITLQNVLAAGKISIERSTGDVKFDGCDAAELFIQTDTGDVEGSLRSDKVFVTTTDTGDVSVPQTTSGGICEITTNTGDVRMNVQ